jgi:uncharacterized membrane protein
MATALMPHRSRFDLGRLALRIDAAYVATGGLMLILGAGPIGRFLGWDSRALAIAGLIFLPYAAWMYWESGHEVMEPRDLIITPAVIVAEEG